MTEPIKAYPLAWPVGWRRTPPYRRRRAQFRKTRPVYRDGQLAYHTKDDISVADAVERVRTELGRMGISDDWMVISTNLELRLDGLPRSGQRMPADPGAAVYWVDRAVSTTAQRCMAVDMYDRVEHNLAAIAATLEAMRAIERHGGAEILNRAFTGFTALPPPMAAQRPWREVFGYTPEASPDEARVKLAYRVARSKAHPDKGGTQEAFLAVEAAYQAAARELGFQP